YLNTIGEVKNASKQEKLAKKYETCLQKTESEVEPTPFMQNAFSPEGSSTQNSTHDENTTQDFVSEENTTQDFNFKENT
ncbi:12102_t:CDS:1, partial [Racocetra persica]